MPRDTHVATRKPREKTNRKLKTPKVLAKPLEVNRRENLTLHDWLLVFNFIDTHPAMPQVDVVKHFEAKKDEALIFTQSMLSRKLRQRENLEAHANSNPNAMSSKRPLARIRHMVEEGENIRVNAPMPKEKRKRPEDALEIPEVVRVEGDGWIPSESFCKTYKINEHRGHGEAGSIYLEAVEAERCVQDKVAPSTDRQKVDESSPFPL